MTPTWPGRPPTLASRLCAAALRLMGWTPVLAAPPGPKLVACIAPHTSNADFWPGILVAGALRLPMHFVAKRELFVWPAGPLLRALGGLPVDRRRAGGNFVDGVVALIGRADELVLVVAPEGTRARGQYWKTGFYYMALEAGVPVAVTVLDWGRRRVGITGYVQPSGDIAADFARIRAQMEGVRGHTPANETPAIPRPDSRGGPSREG